METGFSGFLKALTLDELVQVEIAFRFYVRQLEASTLGIARENIPLAKSMHGAAYEELGNRFEQLGLGRNRP